MQDSGRGVPRGQRNHRAHRRGRLDRRLLAARALRHGVVDLVIGRRRAKRWLGENFPPPRLRSRVRARLRNYLRGRPTVRLRRLIAQGRFPLRVVPARIQRALGIAGGPVSPLRVEIGGGPFPSPGYMHVDADARSAHLEYLAPAWDLPFGAATVEEILAVHVVEHIPPGYLSRTLGEWLRVLRPGGRVQIHVPNATAILHAYLSGDSEVKWAAVSAIYGAPADPAIVRPDDATSRPRWSAHQVLYDLALITEVLEANGFADVEDLSDVIIDRHTAGWQHLIPSMSLVVGARRSPT